MSRRLRADVIRTAQTQHSGSGMSPELRCGGPSEARPAGPWDLSTWTGGWRQSGAAPWACWVPGRDPGWFSAVCRAGAGGSVWGWGGATLIPGGPLQVERGARLGPSTCRGPCWLGWGSFLGSHPWRHAPGLGDRNRSMSPEPRLGPGQQGASPATCPGPPSACGSEPLCAESSQPGILQPRRGAMFTSNFID